MAFLGFAYQAHYLSLYRHTLKLTQQGKINEVSIFLVALLISGFAHSQAIYGPNGEYKGYIQTSPNGVSNSYSATGAFQGSAQVQGNQTNFYGPQGQYQGNIQAPITTPPNTTIGTPPQVNQVPSIKGW